MKQELQLITDDFEYILYSKINLRDNIITLNCRVEVVSRNNSLQLESFNNIFEKKKVSFVEDLLNEGRKNERDNILAKYKYQFYKFSGNENSF